MTYKVYGGSQRLTAAARGSISATDFNFGQYICRVYPNKSQLNFGEKGGGRIQGRLPSFFKVPHTISGMGKATDFKLGRYVHHPNKSPLKILEKKVHGSI